MASNAAENRPGWGWLARTVKPALWPADARGLQARVVVALALVIG